MPLKLDAHDQGLVATVQAAMEKAILTAHNPVTVAKRISGLAIRERNRGRVAAIKRHPFWWHM
jgi:hypothetical protein